MKITKQFIRQDLKLKQGYEYDSLGHIKYTYKPGTFKGIPVKSWDNTEYDFYCYIVWLIGNCEFTVISKCIEGDYCSPYLNYYHFTIVYKNAKVSGQCTIPIPRAVRGTIEPDYISKFGMLIRQMLKEHAVKFTDL